MTTPRIVSDPKVLVGKPVIAGTRISVELILEELGAGTTVDDLLVSFPHITRDDVFAALRYAAQVVHTARPGSVEVA